MAKCDFAGYGSATNYLATYFSTMRAMYLSAMEMLVQYEDYYIYSSGTGPTLRVRYQKRKPFGYRGVPEGCVPEWSVFLFEQFLYNLLQRVVKM